VREREREREFQQLVHEVSVLDNDGVRSYGSHVDNTVQQEDALSVVGAQESIFIWVQPSKLEEVLETWVEDFC
jgi:hypothetical protein